MRRRLTTAMVALSALAVTVFAIPLGVAVRHLYQHDATLALVRAATRATLALPNPATSTSDPAELPAVADTSIALYGRDGARWAGHGPPSADAPVTAALGGRLQQSRDHIGPVVALPVSVDEQVVAVVRAATSQHAIDVRVWRAWAAMAVMAAAVVAVAAGAAALAARRLGAPLDALAAAARRLGDGALSISAPTSGTAEIDTVADALNATAGRLESLLRRERQFRAAASHQLRTPLAALRLRLERAELAPPERQQAEVADALSEVDRLQATIEDLLRLTAETTHHPPTPLEPIIAGIEASWHATLAAVGRRLTVTIEDALPKVPVPPGAIRQILSVLVDNATVHGKGEITLSATSVSGGAAIQVADEGGGPTATMEGLMAGATSPRPGHGMGLALATAIAESEGCRLVLRRDSAGSAFRLLLPAADTTTTTVPPDHPVAAAP